jgi:multiple sugar transport system permease protein
VTRARSRRRALVAGQVWSYAVIAVIGVLVTFPYLWMVLTSFKPVHEFFTFPLRWMSENWTFEQYRRILDDPRFLRSVWNSSVVSVSVTLINLAVGIPAAYGLTRLRPPGSRPMLLTVLSSQFLPPMIFFVPFYIYLGRFQLLNTLTGLTITYLAITLPVAVWLIASAFRQVPAELEDAARIDGCSEAGAAPHRAAAHAAGRRHRGLFSFVLAWQEYIFALLYTTTTAGADGARDAVLLPRAAPDRLRSAHVGRGAAQPAGDRPVRVRAALLPPRRAAGGVKG